ncbi:MAG: insulinase family protein, partial [Candidatus Cloacimonadota bacterium]|nr:insulinase family protein [Candidatus Cloacimonadota bacterium]
MKKLALLILGLIIAQLSANQIQLKTLENGMQIATKENNSNQSAAFYCFVKTGSLNEGKYLGAGISHYLEHVVSSGSTTKRSEAEYNKIGKEIGASTNAYTSTKATAYHLVVNAKYAEDALDMLSEQMQFCKFDSFEVAREKEVILK